MARRTTWSISRAHGEIVVLKNGRSVGSYVEDRKDAETYIRKHMSPGDRVQFIEPDGYAVPLSLRPR